MKKLLLVFLLIFSSPLFASGINANSASAPCTNNTLETYSGNSNLQADWQPNTINLRWYNEDQKLTVQSSAQSCTYDGTLTIPSTQPTRTGYTFAGWEVKHTVPTGYTELEYLENTGGQSINTDIIGAATWRLTAVSEPVTSYPYNTILVGYGANGPTWFGALYNGYWGCGSTIAGAYSNVSYATKADIEVNFNVGFENGTVNSVPFSKRNEEYTSFDSYYYLFSLGSNFSFKGKLWKASCIQNGVLVRNFVPARRNSDNVLGMWDTVSKTFFTNSGTGTFIAGPVVQ